MPVIEYNNVDLFSSWYDVVSSDKFSWFEEMMVYLLSDRQYNVYIRES